MVCTKAGAPTNHPLAPSLAKEGEPPVQFDFPWRGRTITRAGAASLPANLTGRQIKSYSPAETVRRSGPSITTIHLARRVR